MDELVVFLLIVTFLCLLAATVINKQNADLTADNDVLRDRLARIGYWLDLERGLPPEVLLKGVRGVLRE